MVDVSIVNHRGERSFSIAGGELMLEVLFPDRDERKALRSCS